MSGQEGQDYRSGPHPTVAGNMFDPRVHGEDVRGAGGTGEGITQDRTGLTGDNSAVTGGSTTGLTGGSSSGLTGGSSSGLTDDSSSGLTGSNTSGGLTGGSGSGLTGGSTGSGLTGSNTGSGLTGSEGSGLTNTTSNNSSGGGIVNNVLSYVGLGGNSGTNDNAGKVSDYDSSRIGGTSTGTGIGSTGTGLGSDRTQGDYSSSGIGSGESELRSGSGVGSGLGSGLSDRTRGDTTGAGIGSGEDDLSRGSSTGLGSGAGLGAAGVGAGAGAAAYEGTRDRDSSRTGGSLAADDATDREPGLQDTRNKMRDVTDAPGANDGDSTLAEGSRGSTAGTTGTGSTANPSTDESASSGATANTSDDTTSGEKKPGNDDKIAAKRENPDAIPTAGGKKVGEGHMGESKIVPADPRPHEDETASNTAKNAGAGGNDAGEHKEGLMGKLKDRMGGHKN